MVEQWSPKPPVASSNLVSPANQCDGPDSWYSFQGYLFAFADLLLKTGIKMKSMKTIKETAATRT